MSSQYDRGTVEHVLQHLREWGVPDRVVETVTIEVGKRHPPGSVGVIRYYGNLFAEYKYFEGIEQPLFRFRQSAKVHAVQRIEAQEDGTLRAKFRLMLSPHHTPALMVEGPEATPELHDFLVKECLSGLSDKPGHRVMKAAGAFFQGGRHQPRGGWFYVEFAHSRHAQAFVDFVNANYHPKQTEPA